MEYKEIEVTEHTYKMLQIIKKNSKETGEEFTDDEVIRFLLKRLAEDIEQGLIWLKIWTIII